MTGGTWVELTAEETALFLEFRKHQDNFMILAASGVFEIPSGKIEININNGKIQNIFRHEMVYIRLTPEA